RLLTPITCAIALVVGVSSAAFSGQQPTPCKTESRGRKSARCSMPTPLLPAEEAWLEALASPPSAGGAMDAERVYIPLQPETLVAPARHKVVSDGARLYFALDDARMVALDPKDGARVWEQTLAGKLSEPAVAAPNRVFVGSDNNRLYALDARNGKIEWQWRSG